MDLLALPRRQALADALRRRGWRLATAESCTGGLIAAACTQLAGSSDWFERGFVTYSNAAKTELLGVDAALIDAHGAVSEAVARAMAQGALARAPVRAGGGRDRHRRARRRRAGQAGGHGLAGLGHGAGVRAERLQLDGDRDAVRMATVRAALQRLTEAARPHEGAAVRRHGRGRARALAPRRWRRPCPRPRG